MRSLVAFCFFFFQILWNASATTTYDWGGAYVNYGSNNCSTVGANEVTAFAAGVCAQVGFLNYRLYECDSSKLTVWNCIDNSCNTASSCSIFIQENYGTCVYDTSESTTYIYNCWEDNPQLSGLDKYLKVEYFAGFDCDGDPFEYQIYELNVCDGQLQYDCNEGGDVDIYDCAGNKQTSENTGECFQVFGEPTSFKFTCGTSSASALSFSLSILALAFFLICFWM